MQWEPTESTPERLAEFHTDATAGVRSKCGLSLDLLGNRKQCEVIARRQMALGKQRGQVQAWAGICPWHSLRSSLFAPVVPPDSSEPPVVSKMSLL